MFLVVTGAGAATREGEGDNEGDDDLGFLRGRLRVRWMGVLLVESEAVRVAMVLRLELPFIDS